MKHRQKLLAVLARLRSLRIVLALGLPKPPLRGAVGGMPNCSRPHRLDRLYALLHMTRLTDFALRITKFSRTSARLRVLRISIYRNIRG
ncbi:hypothetical protein Micbo1qcDRAFT_170048 [Microdochium bolleyi]|uniref:Secreted protein n=1 Tax=Microdochium bolleyi TaxID=196109 RepID=A0A136II57_9PEZI|nr:hypothetical protein Micbo1qcDRAFT_170048 [Microdochium bolleyi]